MRAAISKMRVPTAKRTFLFTQLSIDSPCGGVCGCVLWDTYWFEKLPQDVVEVRLWYGFRS